jgi:hypothetical protein
MHREDCRRAGFAQPVHHAPDFGPLDLIDNEHLTLKAEIAIAIADVMTPTVVRGV